MLTETKTRHTPGPWIYDERVGCVAIYEGEERQCLDLPSDFFIAYTHGTRTEYGWEIDQQKCADFKRIVACVNGCEGINPEAVEDLLAACETLKAAGTTDTDEALLGRAFLQALCAITKARVKEVPA